MHFSEREPATYGYTRVCMKYLLFALFVSFGLPAFAQAEEVIDITFPVEGEVTFQDDFNDARSGGRTHNATDIMADKMTPVVAAAAGEVTFAPMTEPSYGFMLTIEGDDGYTYNYIHLNNDTPGTDDGDGGHEYAYVDGIERGVRVERGEHIAWVGDSGNAESTSPHLHFEIYYDGTAINPYASLVDAYGVMTTASYDFDPAQEEEMATSINDDKDIPEADGATLCESDSLIRTPEVSTVYYCGRDGGRYLFQNESTFFSWYDDFSTVQYVTTEEMGEIPLRGTVTYKPGTYMIKLLSVPKVYAIARNGTMRWIPTETIARSLYGENWASLVRDLPDGFFPAYEIGEDITSN